MDEGKQISRPIDGVLRQLTVDVLREIWAEIGLVGFWQNPHAQNTLRSRLATRLAKPMIDGDDLFDFTRTTALADRLVELAKANHARLVGG